MSSGQDILIRNVDVLKSGVGLHSIIGLCIALTSILIASLVVGYQMLGEVSLQAFIYAQSNNFALRILDFMPFAFAFWGQYTGGAMARQAGELIMQQTDDLRAQSTAWKRKSLHHSTHDQLTDLPNRSLFYEHLRNAVLVAARENRVVTVLYLDLDGFAEVNDTFGHRNGDLLLKYLAQRLQGLIQGKDIVARLGGDEFGIALNNVPSPDICTGVVDRIHQSLKSPFILDETRIAIGASIGAAHYPENGEAADILLQHAEAAMYAAKRSHDGYAVYAPELDQDNPRRLMLMSELRHAIETSQLELYYQPKVDMQTGKTTSVEALVRWTHPDAGRISPAEFVPVAERSRLIRPLTRWVIGTAMQQADTWRKQGLDLGIAINISARDLSDPTLAELIADCLGLYDIDPGNFTLEVTESCIMDNPHTALEMLNRLSSMNFRLAIDDFGTGYSSLAYLSKMPVQELKIDQTFVFGMLENREDALIVQSTISLGHGLGLKVVSEGVENEAVWTRLREWGCDVAQGYFISPPQSHTEFDRWIRESSWGRAPGKATG